MESCKNCEKRETCTEPCEWLKNELNDVTKNRLSDKEIEFDPDWVNRHGAHDGGIADVEARMVLETLLTEDELFIWQKKIDGYNQAEIGEMVGRSQQEVGRIMAVCLEKIKKGA